MIYQIYKAEFQNKKVYIGLTSDLVRRKWEHSSLAKRSKTLFHRALNKYKDCKWSVIYQCNNLSLAKKMEKIFIQEYKAFERQYGYNLTLGGDGVFGYKASEEQNEKNRIRGKILAKKNNPENNLKKFYEENPKARSLLLKEYWRKNCYKMDYALKNLTGTGKPKRPIALIDKENNILSFDSLAEACKTTKIHMSALSRLVNKKAQIANGYKLHEGNL